MADIKDKKIEIDWTINVGELLSVATLLVLGTFFLANQQAQIDRNATAIEINAEQIEKVEERHMGAFDRIRDHLVRIENKLDRKADK